MKGKFSFETVDHTIASTMHRYGFRLLRYSLAITFIWFGVLKPLELSPAQELVERTVFWFPPEMFVPILGWWEVLIGILLLFRITVRVALLLLFLQIPGTFLPLVLLPDVTFTQFPFGLTMEGQYIIKNLILIAAAITVGGVVNKPDSRKEYY